MAEATVTPIHETAYMDKDGRCWIDNEEVPRELYVWFRRMADALKWYANKANYAYDDFESIPGWYESPGVYVHDEGSTARIALGMEPEWGDA